MLKCPLRTHRCEVDQLTLFHNAQSFEYTAGAFLHFKGHFEKPYNELGTTRKRYDFLYFTVCSPFVLIFNFIFTLICWDF